MNLKKDRLILVTAAGLSVFFILTFLSFFSGLKRITVITQDMANWCKSLFLLCLPYVTFFKTALFAASTAIVLGGILYASIKGVNSILKGRSILKKLPIVKIGAMRLIKDDNLPVAFTHGIFLPRIYVSRALLKILDYNEAKSVLLHEIHHKRQMDPLRIFALNFFKDALFYLPITRWLAGELLKIKELEADNNVVRREKDPLTLASALLKVAKGKNVYSLMPAGINGSGSIEDRIKRLLNYTGHTGSDGEVVKRILPLSYAIKSAIIAMVIFAGITLPVMADGKPISPCSTNHCAMHDGHNSHDSDCIKHCKAKDTR